MGVETERIRVGPVRRGQRNPYLRPLVVATSLGLAFGLGLGVACTSADPTSPTTEALSAPGSRPHRADPSRQPRPADRGLGPHGELRPSPADRCPVCAMRPDRHPQSAAGLATRDGRTFYFCGNRCLLRAQRDPGRYLGISLDHIARTSVLNYFSGQPLDAKEAFWIVGSDVVGPMGPAVVTVGSQEESERFVKRHGGPHRFRLRQLDEGRWRSIFGSDRDE